MMSRVVVCLFKNGTLRSLLQHFQFSLQMLTGPFFQRDQHFSDEIVRTEFVVGKTQAWTDLVRQLYTRVT